MKRKILALTLILIVLCLCFTACGSAEETIEEIAFFNDGALSYVLLKEKATAETAEVLYIKVLSYIGTECLVENDIVIVDIPSSVAFEGKDYDVKKIGSLAFHQKKVTQINVEEGITDIENFAFGYCDMSVMNLPSTIHNIGDYAFAGCNSFGILNLKATTPPTVGDYAFKIYINDKNVYAVNAKLRIYVPSDSLAKYKDESKAPSWSDYTGILSQD